MARQLRETLAHQQVTYADIVKNSPAEQTMFPRFIQASFAFQDIRNRPTTIADLTVEQIDVPRLHTESPIEFWVRIQPGGFMAVFDYDGTTEGREIVMRLKDNFSKRVLDVENLVTEIPVQAELPDDSFGKKPFWRKLFG